MAAVSAPANAPARNLLTSAGQPIICCRTDCLTSDPSAAKQSCCHCVFCRAAAVVEEKSAALARLLPFVRMYNGLMSMRELCSDVPYEVEGSRSNAVTSSEVLI
jgi:hypothetical protein